MPTEFDPDRTGSSSPADQQPVQRHEDFPVDSFRHLEHRIGQIRRDVLQGAAENADARTPDSEPEYRVEKEDVAKAMQRLLKDPSIIDWGLD